MYLYLINQDQIHRVRYENNLASIKPDNQIQKKHQIQKNALVRKTTTINRNSN
jgi:NDP-sugar pyrophosphorylase family protein